jgi:hypothetical protein
MPKARIETVQIAAFASPASAAAAAAPAAPAPPAATRSVRIVVISDTHKEHDRLTIPPGDILVHCGDFTHKRDWVLGLKTPDSLHTFNQWLGTLPHKHKVRVSAAPTMY